MDEKTGGGRAYSQTWGRCKSCNVWSYVLDGYHGICPKCKQKKDKEEPKLKDETK